MITIDWIIGISFMFGLALFLNSLTFKNMSGFFVFLTLFSSFMIWGGLLPLWVLIFNLIILCFVIYFEIYKKGNQS